MCSLGIEVLAQAGRPIRMRFSRLTAMLRFDRCTSRMVSDPVGCREPPAQMKYGCRLIVVSATLLKRAFNNIDTLLKFVQIYFVENMRQRQFVLMFAIESD